MSTCTKCGAELKENAKFCKSCGGQAGLDDKKARVMKQEKRSSKPVMIGIVVALVVIGIGGFMQVKAKRMGGQPMFTPHRDASTRLANAALLTATNGEVRIPVKAMEDGNAHFFAYTTGDKTVTFFVMRAADGSIKTAFDACMACNHAKLGYRQEGKLVVCNNCGMGFAPEDIGKQKGGCNPIPVRKTEDGQMIVLKAKDLDAGVQYF